MAEGSKKKYVRICVDCGKVMRTAGRCTMRCPECQVIHRKCEDQRRKQREKEERIRAKVNKQSQRQKLHEDMKAAEKAGMTYGKWRIQQMLQAQKGAS